jgi:hypothetical protein
LINIVVRVCLLIFFIHACNYSTKLKCSICEKNIKKVKCGKYPAKCRKEKINREVDGFKE